MVGVSWGGSKGEVNATTLRLCSSGRQESYQRDGRAGLGGGGGRVRRWKN